MGSKQKFTKLPILITEELLVLNVEMLIQTLFSIGMK